jgi:23S rRNA (pseudouridine1915-N3)-methyltransferase
VKIIFLLIGKTTDSYLIEAINEYTKRVKRYVSFGIIVLPELKNNRNLTFEQQKEKEGEAILSFISGSDEVILLDDKGKEVTSIEFSAMVQKKMIDSVKQVVFVVVGPYGFSPEVYQRANLLLSLSRMTFSHQLVRLIFMEQLYRSFTIIRGEPYHHE